MDTSGLVAAERDFLIQERENLIQHVQLLQAEISNSNRSRHTFSFKDTLRHSKKTSKDVTVVQL
jgi:hypothetical protein